MLRHMPKEIFAVGIELEGGFDVERDEYDEMRSRPIGGGEYKHDGSVNVDDGWEGEAVSPPMRKWPVIAQWIRNNYPMTVNETCGLHVHVSFKDSTGSMLAESSEFQEYHMDWLRHAIKNSRHMRSPSRARLLERLDGDNEYCENHFVAERQLQDGESRYTMLNFSSFAVHGTLEVRTLGMPSEAEGAVDMVRSVLECIRTFKRKQQKTARFKGKRTLAHGTAVLDDGPILVEIFHENNGLLPIVAGFNDDILCYPDTVEYVYPMEGEE